ncbi:MAG: tetratricopeptide repeat protein [Candidatus Cyclobacteriaceae bacterium M3_2C_046]
MNERFFWRSWPSSYALIYKILLILLAANIIMYLIAWIWGKSLAYDWEVINQLEQIQVPGINLQIALFNLNIPATNYLNIQEYWGSDLSTPLFAAYLQSILFLLGFSLILTALSGLQKFWFTFSMICVIVGFTFLGLENLVLFGQTDNTALIIALVFFVLPAYYFNAIKPDTDVVLRLGVFLTISIIFLVLIYFGSEVSQPVLYFANYSITIPMVLSLLFILTVGHEIISFFLYLITNANTDSSQNSSIHFTVISAVYLLSLFFVYLENTGIANWNLIYISPFLIIIISAILGIWEFRKRNSMYSNIIRFQPSGAYLYLGLAVICFSTISYFFMNANDPALEAFEDLILFSHLGFGLIFFIYIIANFFTLLHYNHKVYRVLYDPKRMPYFTARLAGIIAVLAFFFHSGKMAYYQARAGYYNGLGDTYKLENDYDLAIRFYEQGTIYGYKNHHSHYALGSMLWQQNQPNDALYYFQQATEKKPTPQAFINLSNVYKSEGQFFQSLFSLQDGWERFPGNGPIANNLALLYNRTNVYDSVLYYFDQAETHAEGEAIARANRWGFLSQKQANLSADSIAEVYLQLDDPIARSNLLIFLNQKNQSLPQANYELPQGDSVLNFNQYVFLQNYLVNQFYRTDTLFLNQLDPYIEHSGSFFNDNMTASQALAYASRGDLYKAFSIFQQLLINDFKQANQYHKKMGLLALKQDAPRLASDYFNRVLSQGDSSVLVPQVMTLLSSGRSDQAQDLLKNHHKSNHQVHLITRYLSTPFSPEISNDSLKYLYLYFEKEQLLPDLSIDFWNSFTNQPLKALALWDALDWYLNQEQLTQARLMYDYLQNISAQDDHTNHLISLSYLRLLAQEQQFDALEEKLSQTGKWLEYQFPVYFIYFKALLAQQKDQTDEATMLFNWLGRSNPFFEPGVLSAASFLEQNSSDELAAYNILLNAIRLNSYSAPLYEAYILQALNLGLFSFAEQALLEYQQFVTVDTYQEFRKTYNEKASQEYQDWENGLP